MVDWDYVETLVDQLGCDGLSEIVALFIEETTDVAARLDPERDGVLDDLHFIKGSAENLGLRRLSQMCRAGELAVRDGQLFDAAALVACFRASCDALSKRFAPAA